MGNTRKKNLQLPWRMRLKNGAYYFVEPNTEKWIKLESQANQAKAFSKYYEVVDRPVQTNLMGDLLDRYMKEVAPTKSPNTYKDHIYSTKSLRKVFSQMRAHEVKPYHVYKYLDVRGKQAPVRANREVSLLSSVFSSCIKWGVIESNPCRDVRRNKETPRDRYITDQEFLAVRELAPPMIQLIMDFAYLTGQRLGDVLKIKLSDMIDDGINLIISKVKKKAIIEWNEELRAVVADARALHGKVSSLYLFANHKKQPYTTHGFKCLWQRIMNQAVGKIIIFKKKKDPKTGKLIKIIKEVEPVIQERFTFNDIRAKAASDADDIEHARRLLVHATQRTTGRVYIRKLHRICTLSSNKIRDKKAN